MKRFAWRLVVGVFLAVQIAPIAASAQATAPISGVKGKLQAVTGNSLDILSPSGPVHVTIERPLVTYRQTPSNLSHVTPSSFVGVASVKQANGVEVATQIKIFPAELRGAGEGSRMMGGPMGNVSHSRMTNGSVSRPTISHSRMTNGTVQQGNGTTLVVHYQNGSQTISVPPNVPVTEVARGEVTLMPGDTVYAATTKQANGTLTTNKVFLIAEVTTQNAMR